MKLGNPYMNYRKDLDECLTYFKLNFNKPNFRMLIIGMSNLLSHFK